MLRPRFLLSLALAIVVTPGCGGDDPAGPSAVTFPALPAGVLAAYCVQGERTPGQPIAGTLAGTDCPFGDGSFYEVWRVRVPAGRGYRFAAASTFDNLLFVLRLESHTDTSATVTQIAADDDGGGGTNALISSVVLSPGTDYFVVVNGFDSTDTGPYTVAFTAP